MPKSGTGNTGIPGIRFEEDRKRYRVYGSKNRRYVFIGMFEDLSSAIVAKYEWDLRNPLSTKQVDRIDGVLVDDKYEFLLCGPHHVDSNGYVSLRFGGRLTRLHRVIMQLEGALESDKVVDHINQNKLDNRTCNLRCVSNNINVFNGRRRKNNKSGVAGVFWSEESKRWMAQGVHNRKAYHLGSFVNKVDAIKARKAFELNTYGEVRA